MNFEAMIVLFFAIEITALCTICFFMNFTNKLTQETLFLMIKWIEKLHKLFSTNPADKQNEKES